MATNVWTTVLDQYPETANKDRLDFFRWAEVPDGGLVVVQVDSEPTLDPKEFQSQFSTLEFSGIYLPANGGPRKQYRFCVSGTRLLRAFALASPKLGEVVRLRAAGSGKARTWTAE